MVNIGDLVTAGSGAACNRIYCRQSRPLSGRLYKWTGWVPCYVLYNDNDGDDGDDGNDDDYHGKNNNN